MIDETFASAYGSFEVAFKKFHKSLGRVRAVVDGKVVVDSHENPITTIAYSIGRFDLYTDLIILGSSSEIDLRHGQRRHSTLCAVNSKILAPISPWIHRRKGPADSISIGRTTDAKVDVSIDTECAERCVVELFLEYTHDQIAYADIRCLQGLSRELIVCNIDLKLVSSECGGMPMRYLQVGTICHALR